MPRAWRGRGRGCTYSCPSMISPFRCAGSASSRAQSSAALDSVKRVTMRLQVSTRVVVGRAATIAGMIQAAKLGGFFAAHAVWSVSDGEMLIPMLAYQSGDEDRQMIRLAGEDAAQSVEIGRAKLEQNDSDADDAALFYDGFITIDSEKLDAIIIEMRAYFAPDARAMLAVPYTPPRDGSEFRVHRPKLVVWENCGDFDIDAALEAFFEGVDAHEQGAAVWASALDESK